MGAVASGLLEERLEGTGGITWTQRERKPAIRHTFRADDVGGALLFRAAAVVIVTKPHVAIDAWLPTKTETGGFDERRTMIKGRRTNNDPEARWPRDSIRQRRCEPRCQAKVSSGARACPWRGHRQATAQGLYSVQCQRKAVQMFEKSSVHEGLASATIGVHFWSGASRANVDGCGAISIHSDDSYP